MTKEEFFEWLQYKLKSEGFNERDVKKEIKKISSDPIKFDQYIRIYENQKSLVYLSRTDERFFIAELLNKLIEASESIKYDDKTKRLTSDSETMLIGLVNELKEIVAYRLQYIMEHLGWTPPPEPEQTEE